ncbi:acyl-CoA thioester hydrolase/BAAT C-terminal domain-containing protein [Absicoccus intestinalis]|uniref:BAAT/Acyl-CoA thioester hydrolase C-terminal domain-containing protein n=1 Tax=Absicoccus intestinalis TaxID=2926319 RepID=A0ABU4WJA9_9FIRM|nr:acyl-CoA thioester hydrolase/BAAT C-terminal domain-containing protein [Absicoccus sp. CLA-KB-P134]MDX8416631.1 hypothetical protein [Absicoccus sp. CLA-KB-P134]
MKFNYKFDEDGFSARYYQGKASNTSILIILSTMRNDAIAKAFTEAKMDTLALDFIEPGREISLDDISFVAETMHAQGYEHVGLWGWGLGGSVALGVASHYPEDIDLVIGVNPFHILYQPLSIKPTTMTILYKGLPLPLLKPETKMWKQVAKEMKCSHEFHTVDRYEQCLTYGLREEMIIPVEKCQCPILLLSSQNDVVLPSEYACRQIVRRLQDHDYRYGARHLHYQMVSHAILPPKAFNRDRLLYRRISQIERNYPKHCQKARQDAFQKTLTFIQDKWPEANE